MIKWHRLSDEESWAPFNKASGKEDKDMEKYEALEMEVVVFENDDIMDLGDSLEL